jgi:hypothetical protein
MWGSNQRTTERWASLKGGVPVFSNVCGLHFKVPTSSDVQPPGERHSSDRSTWVTTLQPEAFVLGEARSDKITSFLSETLNSPVDLEVSRSTAAR